MIEFYNPYTRVTLVYPVKDVKKYVKFILLKVGIPDLEDALFNCWQISASLSEEERKMLAVVQTIVSATKDGYIKPEDFDIFRLAGEVAAEAGININSNRIEPS